MVNYTEKDIERIDLEDTAFSFSFPEEVDSITESIGKIGLLQPPLLYHNRIVCGRRRILACKRLGWKKIPARLIDGNQPEIEIFRLNLGDNLSVRELNIIEKSRILNKLLNIWQVPQEKIIKEYLPMLSIPANIRYLNKYIWLEEVPDELKTGLSLDTLIITREWPKRIRNKALQLVLSFGFGKNKTSEILRLLRNNKFPLQSKEWLKIKNNPDIPSSQKGLWLRNFLLKKRYPMHTEFKNRVKSLIAKLNLPENISIELDDLLTWEEDSINLRLKCKKKEDLEQSIKHLNSLSTSKELSELLEMLSL